MFKKKRNYSRDVKGCTVIGNLDVRLKYDVKKKKRNKIQIV